MNDTANIREHMEVISADGAHVGTVDHIDGQRIKLARNDRGAGDRHHFISVGLVAGVEGDKVRLSTTSANVAEFLTTE